MMDKNTRETAYVEQFGDKGKEAWFRWFEHVQIRDREYIGQRMLSMELPGGRKRGTLEEVHGYTEGGVTQQDALSKVGWRQMI